MESYFYAYIVLAIGIATNFYALSLSSRKLRRSTKKASVLKSFVSSNLIEIKSTFVTDLMGTFSAAFGIAALLLYGITKSSRYDGLGAMLIGATIAVFAVILIKEVKDMIIGKSASPEKIEKITKIVESCPQVVKLLRSNTMHFGSEEIYANLNIKVKRDLKTAEIENAIQKIEDDIKKALPEVDQIQTEIDRDLS